MTDLQELSLPSFVRGRAKVNWRLSNLKSSPKLRAAQVMAICAWSPMWDPLRGDPRFEKIVASLAPKEVR